MSTFGTKVLFCIGKYTFLFEIEKDFQVYFSNKV